MSRPDKQAILMVREEILRCVQQIAGSLQSEGLVLPGPSADAITDAGLVGSLPAWVARFGLAIDGDNAWLYCEPYPGAESDMPGQALLHLPPGRYLVDTFETASCGCIGRESAEGGPLVVGLVFTGSPVLLYIHSRGFSTPDRTAS
jgi:hypothetical protein